MRFTKKGVSILLGLVTILFAPFSYWIISGLVIYAINMGEKDKVSDMSRKE